MRRDGRGQRGETAGAVAEVMNAKLESIVIWGRKEKGPPGMIPDGSVGSIENSSRIQGLARTRQNESKHTTACPTLIQINSEW
jgi:hypothetical protein